MAVFALLGSLAVPSIGRFGPQLYVKGTPSEPRGIYRLEVRRPDDYRRGMFVIFPVPSAYREMVYGRGWLKLGVPFLKEVVALAGDRVCVDARAFSINGTQFGPLYEKDRVGRPLPHQVGCYAISPGD